MRSSRVATAVLLLSLTAPVSAAVVLETSGMITGTTGSFACTVTNAGTAPATVLLHFLNPNGGEAGAQSDTCVTLYAGSLPPGETCLATRTASAGTLIRCKVESTSAKVRAALLMQDADGNTTAVYPATKK